MTSRTVIIALVCLFAGQAFAGICKPLFDARAYAISHNDPNSVLVINDLINAKGIINCCPATTNRFIPSDFTCNANSGPVCGWDFQTYSNECAACAVGVQFAGACKPSLNIINCYGLTGAANFAARLGCFYTALGTIVNTVMLNNQPLDVSLIQPPCYIPGVRDQVTFRTADGSCNNKGDAYSIQTAVGLPLGVSFSYSGMAGIRFVNHDRSVAPANFDLAEGGGPNPRLVSNLLFKRNSFIPNRVNLNSLTVAWIGYFVHDFFLHTNDWQEIVAVPIPTGDPVWGNYGGDWTVDKYMYVPRTLASQDSSYSGSRLYRNKATSWFDASQVYGSDQTTAASLRTFTGGLLATSAGNLLPNLYPPANYDDDLATAPLFQCGDIRCNQHAGLTSMHTLFVREHNNVATQLAAQYPTMTDDQLYGTARLIVAAEMIKIQTVEMSTQLVDDPAQQAIVQTLWQQAGTGAAPNPLATHLVPEDFIAAYKWHSMVPDTVTLRDSHGNNAGTFDYLGTFQNTTVVRANGIEKILIGMASQPGGWLTIRNYPDGIRNLGHPNVNYRLHSPFDSSPSCVVVPGIDLGTIDILRERERGLPKYNNYLRTLGNVVPFPTNFAMATPDSDSALKLALLYNWNIENVDFIVGMLAADTDVTDGLPQAATAGFLPFVYSRLKFDRFYTTDYNANVYTNFGFNRVRGTAANPNGVMFADIFRENGIISSIPNGYAAKIFKTWAW